MSTDKTSLLHRQIGRVSRRLFLQTLLGFLAMSWTVAVLVSVIWFLAQPLLLPMAADGLRWLVLGGLLGVATVTAVVLARLRAPSRVASALALDEKFQLKERVTTSLTLTPEQAQSPAGMALLADVQQRLEKLQVASAFPMQWSRWMALVPLSALVLVVVALFHEPPPPALATPAPTPAETKLANAQDIDKKMSNLVPRKPPEQQAAEPLKSDELKRIEAELEKIASRPRDTAEDVRDRLQEARDLEEMIKNREQDLAAKAQAVQQQLQQLDQLMKKNPENQEGPAQDLHKALSEGDMDKAQEELDRLSKKLKNNELTDKDKEQLQKQLQDIHEKLDRLSRQQDQREQLEQLAREGKLDPETLERELERLQRENEQLKDLEELSRELQECQKCMNEGKDGEAAERLSRAAQKMQPMSGDNQEMQQLQEQLQRLQEAQDAMAKGLQQQQNGRGGEGVGSGRRPVGAETQVKSFDAKAKTDFDPKGKKIFDGYAPGQVFKKRTQVEMEGEIRQASQEAPSALDQQRIPKTARDIAKDYFRAEEKEKK
ncbi:MAG: hypothetical protein ACK4RK_05205 [Gemmataceae bacterium]